MLMILGSVFLAVIGVVLVVRSKKRFFSITGVLLALPFVILLFSIAYNQPFFVQGAGELWIARGDRFEKIPPSIWKVKEWRSYTNGCIEVQKMIPETLQVTVFHNCGPVFVKAGVSDMYDDIIFRKYAGRSDYSNHAPAILTSVITDSFYANRSPREDLPAEYVFRTNAFIADLKSKGVTVWSIAQP